MDFSPLIAVLEGDFNKDNASSTTEIDTLENLDDTKQISKGKPPRHLSAMQNITSTTTRLQVINLYDSTISASYFLFWLQWDSSCN